MPPKYDILKKLDEDIANYKQGNYTPVLAVAQTAHDLAQFGLPIAQIAAMCKVSPATLTKYYGDDIEKGRAKTSQKIGEAIVAKAEGGDMTAAALWAKAHMGFNDTTRHEVVGAVEIAKIERVIIDDMVEAKIIEDDNPDINPSHMAKKEEEPDRMNDPEYNPLAYHNTYGHNTNVSHMVENISQEEKDALLDGEPEPTLQDMKDEKRRADAADFMTQMEHDSWKPWTK